MDPREGRERVVGREAKYRKKNEKEARSQWWQRRRKGGERKREASFMIPWGETSSAVCSIVDTRCKL